MSAPLSEQDREDMAIIEGHTSRAEVRAAVSRIVARHEAEALLSARAAYLRAFSDAPTQDAVHVLTWLMDRAVSVEAQGGAE